MSLQDSSSLPPCALPCLISVEKIWDSAPHNALTDLIWYQDRWLCTFRESDAHVFGKNGTIRILESFEGKRWHSIALIEESGVDLRDPKFSITPNGRLMLLVGGSVYRDKEAVTRQPRVAFSSDAKKWTLLEKICSPLDWLWRVTWHEGRAWGVSYCPPAKGEELWRTTLYSSLDGLKFQEVIEWKIPGKPNETTLRFLPDHTMVALVRRNFSNDPHEVRSSHPFPTLPTRSGAAWIGSSQPPYQDWKWSPAKHHLGGPNFLILQDNTMWASGRLIERNPYGFFEKTALCQMTLQGIRPVLILPSGGRDTSYPGMVYQEEKLWISYYSSHEGKTAIYLALVAL